MRGPELRFLVRSLRTKNYEKLPIRKHLAALASRQEGEARELPPEEEFVEGEESHGQDESDSQSL